MKTFLIATNTDYTLMCNAINVYDAARKAKIYYMNMYGEERDDFVPYEIGDYIKNDMYVVSLIFKE